MECIGKTGTFPRDVTISDIRKERDGFLKIFTFASSDVDFRLDVMHRGDSVFVLPVDSKGKRIYLVHQPRHVLAFSDPVFGRSTLESDAQEEGAAKTVSYWQITTLDAPAGSVEQGERPEAAAIRELQEEVGIACREDDLISCGSVYASIGGSTERLHLFIAEVGEFASVDPKGDGTERLEVYKVSFREAFELLKNGRIANAGGRMLLEAFWRSLMEKRINALVDTLPDVGW